MMRREREREKGQLDWQPHGVLDCNYLQLIELDCNAQLLEEIFRIISRLV